MDVGAWYGPWTRKLTKLADAVVAIEPANQLANHLRAAFPTAQIVEAAASDAIGTATLHVPSIGPLVGTSSLEYGEGIDVEVRRITIDSLDLSDVSFIKLDVEGHELPALLGAANTIDRDGPLLLIEMEVRIHPLEPVLDLLRAWGYRGYVLPHHTWIPLADIDLAAHQRAAIARVSQSFIRRVVWPRPRYINSVLFRR
jgi:FkbM family methyltransferase